MARFGSDTRPIIGRGPSLVARFLLLAAISIGLMVADHRNNDLTKLRNIMSAGIYPAHWLVDAPFRASSWLMSSFADRDQLRNENARLAAQVRDLQVSVQRLAAVTAENQIVSPYKIITNERYSS